MTPKSADPQRILQHADDLKSDVVPMVKKAGDTLNKDGTYNLEGGDFSIACVAAGSAYPMAIQFAFEDIKMLMKTVQGFAEKIDQSAINYRNSEQSSTI